MIWLKPKFLWDLSHWKSYLFQFELISIQQPWGMGVPGDAQWISRVPYIKKKKLSWTCQAKAILSPLADHSQLQLLFDDSSLALWSLDTGSPKCSGGRYGQYIYCILWQEWVTFGKLISTVQRQVSQMGSTKYPCAAFRVIANGVSYFYHLVFRPLWGHRVMQKLLKVYSTSRKMAIRSFKIMPPS